MSRPVVSDVAEELYARLAPVAAGDEERGWPLLIYCEALTDPLAGVDDVVRDTDTHDGWEIALDPAACPEAALGWAAQFHGVRLRPDITLAEQRVWVAAAAGLARGSVEAIRASVRPYLTGLKRCDVYERYGCAYGLLAVIYTAEAADPVLAEQQLRAAVPAGIVVTFQVRDGQSYQQLDTGYATYADVASAYATYDDLKHAF